MNQQKSEISIKETNSPELKQEDRKDGILFGVSEILGRLYEDVPAVKDSGEAAVFFQKFDQWKVRFSNKRIQDTKNDNRAIERAVRSLLLVAFMELYDVDDQRDLPKDVLTAINSWELSDEQKESPEAAVQCLQECLANALPDKLEALVFGSSKMKVKKGEVLLDR